MADKKEKKWDEKKVISTQDESQGIRESLNQTANSIFGESNFDKVKSTASQISGAAGRAASVVGTQVGVINQKVWGEELAWEVKDMVSPIATMISDILLVAFFAKKQERVTRGQFIVGSLSVLILVWLAVSIVSAFVGPLGVLWGLIFIATPIINLAAKRFHDINLPWWRWITVLLPLVWRVVPVLYKGDEGDNQFGKDPLKDDKTDLTTYLLTAMSLLIVSLLVTALLGFLWFRGVKSDIDITNPNMIGDEVGNTLPGQFQQPLKDMKDTTDSLNDSMQNTTRNVGKTVEGTTNDMGNTMDSAAKKIERSSKDAANQMN